MPAFLTHMVGAEDVLNKLENPRAKKIIEAHKDAYHSGAQGGDYFYLYHYYSMWVGHTYKMFGYALHRARPQRFFTEGAQYIKEKNSDVLKSFFYGYITHYCFDYLLHPAINAICPDTMKNHNTLEYAIDTMYAREHGIDAIEFDRSEFVRNTLVETDELNEFFSAIMDKLYYGFKLKPGAYHTCYRYFEKYNQKMYKPSEKELRWIKLQNKFTMLDLFTMMYYPYEDVKDMFDYAPFFELIERAVQKSLYYIDLVDKYWNDEIDINILQSAFFNVNFNGIPVTPREERKAFRRLYRKAKLRW